MRHQSNDEEVKKDVKTPEKQQETHGKPNRAAENILKSLP